MNPESLRNIYPPASSPLMGEGIRVEGCFVAGNTCDGIHAWVQDRLYPVSDPYWYCPNCRARHLEKPDWAHRELPFVIESEKLAVVPIVLIGTALACTLVNAILWLLRR